MPINYPQELLPEKLLFQFFRRFSVLFLATFLLFVPFIYLIPNSDIKDNLLGNNTTFFNSQKIGLFKIEFSSLQVMQILPYFHNFIQLFLVIGILAIESFFEMQKNKQYGNVINDYTLQFSNLPQLQPTQLIPLLYSHVYQRLQNSQSKQIIFDIQCSSSQTQINYLRNLMQSYQNKAIQFTESNTINLKIKQQQILKESKLSISPRFVWITFNDLQTKQKCLQTFSNVLLFEQKVKVQQSPYPKEIIWQNLYTNSAIRYSFRFLCILISLICIAVSNVAVMMLRGQESVSTWWKLLAIFALEIVLKSCVLFFSSKEKHDCKSRAELSFLRKLTLMFSLSLGLLPFSTTICCQTTAFLTKEYMSQMGVQAIIVIALDALIKVFDPYIELGIKIGKMSIIHLYNKRKQQWGTIRSLFIASFQKPQANLALLLGGALSTVSIGLLFALVCPLIYFLLALFTFCVSVSYRHFIRFQSNKIPYTTPKSFTTCFRFIYAFQILHLITVVYLVRGNLVLVSFTFVVILICFVQMCFSSKIVTFFNKKRYLINRNILQINAKQIGQKIMSLRNRKQNLTHIETRTVLTETQQDLCGSYRNILNQFQKNLLNRTPSEDSLKGVINYSSVQ